MVRVTYLFIIFHFHLLAYNDNSIRKRHQITYLPKIQMSIFDFFKSIFHFLPSFSKSEILGFNTDIKTFFSKLIIYSIINDSLPSDCSFHDSSLQILTQQVLFLYCTKSDYSYQHCNLRKLPH